MKKRTVLQIVIGIALILLLSSLVNSSVYYILMDRTNFPPGESRVHNHVISFTAGNLTVVKSSEFNLTWYNGSPSILGDSMTWIATQNATISFNLTSPDDCYEDEMFYTSIYYNGSFVDNLVYACVPDYKVRDYKIEYGHGDANYLSHQCIGEQPQLIFNLLRVWNLGHYMDPDEDATDIRMRCHFENYTVRTYGHGDVSYNGTPTMDFLWRTVSGGYWFRIGVLSQDFTGLPVNSTYNVSCEEMTYTIGNQMVRVPPFNYSLEVCSCDALSIQVSEYPTDPSKVRVTVKNVERYTLHDLYFEKLLDGFSEEQHITQLPPNESAYFFMDKTDNYDFRFYFIPAWYEHSLDPQYCMQEFNTGNPAPNVDIVIPEQGFIYINGSYVEIWVRVNDSDGVDSVLANITIPDDGYLLVNMTDPDGDGLYFYNYTSPPNSGNYILYIIANDTLGGVNDVESNYFTIMTGGGPGSVNGTASNGSYYYYYNYESHRGGDDDNYYYYNISNTNITIIGNVTRCEDVIKIINLTEESGFLEVKITEELSEEECDCGETAVRYRPTTGAQIVAEVKNTGKETLTNIDILPYLPAHLLRFLVPQKEFIHSLPPGTSRRIVFMLNLNLCNWSTEDITSFPFRNIPFILQAKTVGAADVDSTTIDLDFENFAVIAKEYEHCEGDNLQLCFLVDNFNKPPRTKLEIEVQVHEEGNVYLEDFLTAYTARSDEILILRKDYSLNHVPKDKGYIVNGYLYQNGSLFEAQRYQVATDSEAITIAKCGAVLEFPGRICPLPGWYLWLFVLLLFLVLFLLVWPRTRLWVHRRRCLFFSLVVIMLAILLFMYYRMFCPTCVLLIFAILLLIIPLVCFMAYLYRYHKDDLIPFCQEMEFSEGRGHRKYKVMLCHIYAPFFRKTRVENKRKHLVVREVSDDLRVARVEGELNVRKLRGHRKTERIEKRKHDIVMEISRAHEDVEVSSRHKRRKDDKRRKSSK